MQLKYSHMSYVSRCSAAECSTGPGH